MIFNSYQGKGYCLENLSKIQTKYSGEVSKLPKKYSRDRFTQKASKSIRKSSPTAAAWAGMP